MDLIGVIRTLLDEYGPRGWWPLVSKAGLDGRDDDGYAIGPSAPVIPGPAGAPERFEIAVAAILAQNTSWRGADKAMRRLSDGRLLSPLALALKGDERLGEAIRPAGTFRVKRVYLKALAEAWPSIEDAPPSRERLLAIKGIGHETADCIMLYCYGSPVFVADAYARRILSRLGLCEPGAVYESVRRLAELTLPSDAPYLAEAHALLVEHAKRRCKTKPECAMCPLRGDCRLTNKNTEL